MQNNNIMFLFVIFILLITFNSCSRSTMNITQPILKNENNMIEENKNNDTEIKDNEDTSSSEENTESINNDDITYCYTFGDRESLEDAKKYARQAAIEKAVISKFSYFKSQKRYDKGFITDDKIASLTKGYIKNIKFKKEDEIDYEDRKICYTIVSIEFENDAIQKIDEKIEQSSDFPGFITVPGKTYTIPEFMKVYLNDYFNTMTFKIPEDFKIMERELSVRHFNQYYVSLDDNDKKQLGVEWKKKDENEPVEYIPYKYVRGYARWLSKQQNKTVRLPSVEEWMAACINFIKSENQLHKYKPVIDKKKPSSEVRQSVDHLLGNLREWSISPCYKDKDKYYLLGGNYISPKIGIYKAFCASENAKWLGGVGIRLIMEKD